MKHLLFFIIISTLSCQSFIIGPDPINTRVNNFEILWKSFDRHYSFFEYKHIDWDSVYRYYKPLVEQSKNDSTLFALCIDMCNGLHDGHVSLYWGNKSRAFSYTNGFPLNMSINSKVYIPVIDISHVPFNYGSIAGTNFGYIKINDFSQGGGFSSPGAAYKYIEIILKAFEGKTGIVIDVRNNGGGNDLNSKEVAAHFLDKKRIYEYTRFRNGEKHNDFTSWKAAIIEPSSGTVFTKPVAVLINRACFSSGESFIRMMTVAPEAFTCGGNSGGGTGIPVKQEMPNGWSFRLSTAQSVTADMTMTEEIGITPDYPVNNSADDIANNRDAILEKAIEILNERTSMRN